MPVAEQDRAESPEKAEAPFDWTATLERVGAALVRCDTRGRILKQTAPAEDLAGWIAVPAYLLARDLVRSEKSFVIEGRRGRPIRVQVFAIEATATELGGYVVKMWPEVARAEDIRVVLRRHKASAEQVEAFLLVYRGLTDKAAAADLQITVQALSQRLKGLEGKMRARNRPELFAVVERAVHQGV